MSSQERPQAGKRQSRLQLSQLEVFPRYLNAKSEYQMTKTFRPVRLDNL